MVYARRYGSFSPSIYGDSIYRHHWCWLAFGRGAFEGVPDRRREVSIRFSVPDTLSSRAGDFPVQATLAQLLAAVMLPPMSVQAGKPVDTQYVRVTARSARSSRWALANPLLVARSDGTSVG